MGKMTRRPQQRGFTFVEILVSMVIVVVLYALAAGPAQQKARQQKLQLCAENLRRLHLTLALYANEHDGAYPRGSGANSADDVLSVLVPRYTSDRSFFSCPATGHSDGRLDFAYVAGLNRDSGDTLLASDEQVDTTPKTKGAQIFADSESTRGGNHGAAGGNLLFADGHVETVGTTTPRDLPLPNRARLLNPAP